MTERISSYFLDRATVRDYSDRPVDPELIDRMLQAAAHAPTTGNMQLYSVIVSASPAERAILAPLHFGQPMVEGCQVVLTFCVDINRFVRWCELGRAEVDFDNLQALMYGVLDTALFAQQFNTIAELNGLGCCYLGTTLFNAPAIAEALKLPPRVVPLITLTVGYPAGEAPKSDRLPARAVIHHGVYRDFSDEDIRMLYAEKEALPDSIRFVKENNLDNLAQVYAQVRYSGSMNREFSAPLARFLARFLAAES